MGGVERNEKVMKRQKLWNDMGCGGRFFLLCPPPQSLLTPRGSMALFRIFMSVVCVSVCIRMKNFGVGQNTLLLPETIFPPYELRRHNPLLNR